MAHQYPRMRARNIFHHCRAPFITARFALHCRYADDPLATFSSYMVTENGVADSTDILRPAFITEHLAAIAAAIAVGIDVTAYIHWTISDNWEWADGYCPKFGLYAVDRSSDDLKRKARPSANLYAEISRSHKVTSEQREAAWAQVVAHRGESRPFCRSTDGKEGLDEPRLRPFSSSADWRFLNEKRAAAHLDTGGIFLRTDGVPAATRAASVASHGPPIWGLVAGAVLAVASGLATANALGRRRGRRDVGEVATPPLV